MTLLHTLNVNMKASLVGKGPIAAFALKINVYGLFLWVAFVDKP